MTDRVRSRSLLVQVLVYAAVATLAFALAAGVGAIGALIVRGDFAGLLEGENSRPADEQDAADRAQQEGGAVEASAVGQDEAASDRDEAAADQDAAASRREDAEYVGMVGAIQARAVETFLESHEKLSRYEALAADDVEEMKSNEATLREMADRATGLAPPRRYEDQHEVFGSAIIELHRAARLSYSMAADPVAAADLGAFDEYDGHVSDASALLQRSNDLLGKDYETIEGVREISPEF